MFFHGGIPFSGKAARMDSDPFQLIVKYFYPSWIDMDFNRPFEICVRNGIVESGILYVIIIRNRLNQFRFKGLKHIFWEWPQSRFIK